MITGIVLSAVALIVIKGAWSYILKEADRKGAIREG
ncbi:hypothetical protein pEaSNUABM11_00214 [Erwinia phage pEa_SNUABM_11]|nr:hypothetical protein pEaSNUABM11_00214 [Erwinia phage pEa_SNUABM_11]